MAQSNQGKLPVLPIGVYRATFAGETKARRFPESAWRGAFGHALRRVACVTREKHCPDCLLYRSCGYAYVFETPPPAGAAKMRRYTHVPHPFTLRVEEHQDASNCTLFLNLFGRGNAHLALVIYALTQAADGSRGISGSRYALQSVEQQPAPGDNDWQIIYSPDGKLEPLPPVATAAPAVPSAARIDIRTPLRVKRNGRHVGPDKFQFADLFGNLLRRISMLTCFHADTPLETDFRELNERALSITADIDLEWHDQKRYSARQAAEMQMGGVTGSVTIRDHDLSPFWPYLWLGQWTHAGAAATMGLGWYELASLRDQRKAA